MSAGAPNENKNAEKWTVEKAIELFEKAIVMAKEKDIYSVGGVKIEGYKYHYLGEIATSDEIDLYPDIFKYFKTAFEECMPLYKRLKFRMESNCFSDSKKGVIKEATAIMNLKSNYQWTDRVDKTTKGKKINTSTVNYNDLSKEELQAVLDAEKILKKKTDSLD